MCLLGPELGPLESLLVAPEGGDWFLEEANVSSSRTGHSDRCAGLQHILRLLKCADRQDEGCRTRAALLRTDSSLFDSNVVLDDHTMSAKTACYGNLCWRCSSHGARCACRFVCRDRIGERQQCSAAFLPAIPQDAVVYGVGDSSVILTKVRI